MSMEEDLRDLLTHQAAWGRALVIALAASPNDNCAENELHWQYELREFHRLFDKLAALSREPHVVDRSWIAGAWQPIETAPKEPGVDILVYRPDAVKDEYIPRVGVDYWSTRLGNVWARSNNQTQPTMWQPMPEPPK